MSAPTSAEPDTNTASTLPAPVEMPPQDAPVTASAPASVAAPFSLTDRVGFRAPWLAAILIAVCGMMVFWHTKTGAIRNTNVGSRYATVQSLVDFGTYAIDDTQYVRTIDKVKIGDQFYSSKPPLLPTMGAGLYAAYKKLTGRNIVKHEHDVVLLCNLVLVLLPHLLMLFFLFRLSRLMTKSDLGPLVALGGAAFAFYGTGYAIELNNHVPAAMLATVSFYYAYRIRHEIDAKPRHWLLAGACAGLLPPIDLPSLFISTGIGLYLLTYDWKRTLTWFMAGAAPGLIAHFVLTYIQGGSLLPIYLRKELYNYPGSYWNKPRGIDALDEPKWFYGLQALIGHHGIFSVTPLSIFGSIAIFDAIRQKGALYREAIMVAGIVGIMFTFYVVNTNNYGGSCVGMRWFISFMPLLLVFLAVWVDTHPIRPLVGSALLVAFLVGQYHMHDAIRSPWHDGVWHRYLNRHIPTIRN